MKKVLIVTYYWPPGSGAGVQRWLKFSKYLPGYGWSPLILTIDPKYATYPAIDPALDSETTSDIRVFRTKATDWFRIYSGDKSKIPAAGFATNTNDSLRGKLSRFIRGNFFIPDPRRGWNRYAFRKAVEIIKIEEVNHLITSSPPHSTQLIGLKLKKKFPHLKWIADFRDPWTEIYYYKLFYPTFIAKYIDLCLEKRVIRKADTIISVGKNLAEMISLRNEKRKVSNIHVIPNGFDEDDFTGISIKIPERYTITYVGTISEAYPRKGLIVALGKVKNKGFDFLLRFVGFVPENIISEFKNILGSDNIEYISYTSHREAITYMADSSVLLLIIPDHLNNKVIITGKLFEYIATGKPILFIGPVDGDAAFHLRSCGHTGIFDDLLPDEIEDFILKTMNQNEPSSLRQCSGYSRKMLTEKLADVLANAN